MVRLATVNGQASMDYPAVVLLLTSRIEQCTGTFISDNLVITAAHCVPKEATGTIKVLLDDCANGRSLEQTSLRIFHGPYAGDDYAVLSQANIEHDAAIVVFPDKVAPATLPLADAAIARGDELVMVGFGSDRPAEQVTPEDYHGFENFVKRKGTIKSDVDAGASPVIELSPNGAAAPFTSKGDSGGPLLRGGKVAGIASYASTSGQRRNGWVNVRGAAVQQLLQNVRAAGFKIP